MFRATMFSLSLAFTTTIAAEAPKEMNLRQSIDNTSMNKIAGARLRGMLAGNGKKQGATVKEDCVTQIGNQEPNSSLVSGNQDVIVLGDVINVCK